MRKILLGGVAAALIAAGAVPASAHPNYHYIGQCGFTTVSDGGDDDQTTWEGEFHSYFIATDAAGVPSPTTPISYECHAYKNGVYMGIYDSGSGIGFAGSSGYYTYQAAPTDVITVCEEVIVGGEHHTECSDADTTPIVPEPVQEAIEGIINDVNDVLILLDPTICAILAQFSPGVPGVLDITPEGDVYVAGEFFWDCPPYAV